ncbi:hypothetical protein Tco_1275447 [Tanacetum coccineum]
MAALMADPNAPLGPLYAADKHPLGLLQRQNKNPIWAKMKMVVAAVMFGGGSWEVVDEGDVSGNVREVMVMTSAAFRVAVGSW